ncbi:MAG: hypothetical protein QOI54_2787 [Actinomycetota bacterium]|jgi:uncharacterized protein YkwD|nr:hypothetical protein [Actinomycetota bacterium]
MTVATYDTRRSAAVLVALALILASFVVGTATARPAGASTFEDTFSADVNGARAARGLPSLSIREELVAVARAQAARMARRSALYHNPNLTSDVHNWRWVGENVGYGPDVQAVHTAFMNSPAHRDNILDRDYTEVGIGVVASGGRVWVAEVFRRPSNAVRHFAARWSHSLRLGSTGPSVQRVQRRLGLRPTGRFGAATRHAVVSFQRHQGWHGHGVVGPKTWKRLF